MPQSFLIVEMISRTSSFEEFYLLLYYYSLRKVPTSFSDSYAVLGDIKRHRATRSDISKNPLFFVRECMHKATHLCNRAAAHSFMHKLTNKLTKEHTSEHISSFMNELTYKCVNEQIDKIKIINSHSPCCIFLLISPFCIIFAILYIILI